MEAVKEESSSGSASTTVKSKLRYPLRSATKKKDDKSAVTNTDSTSPKRRKPQSSGGKSVSFLDTSGNDKPAKPLRRLSVRAKSSISPLPKATGTITPSTHSRTKTYNKGLGSDEKTVSDVSKSISRRKFSVLSSVSYWLSQIKLSESAAKHSVSLGFFKLALESGCEPLQKMCDELKLYVSRHNLVELGEPLKELLTSYKISVDMEQLQVSEICSQVSEESTQSSEAVHNSSVHNSSIDSGKKLKPKASSSENNQLSTIAKTAKRRSTQNTSASKNRGSVNSNPIKSNNVPQKKSQKPTTEVSKKEKSKTQKQGENSSGEKVPVPVDTFSAGEIEQHDKENKDTQQPEESSLLTSS